jgi:hypothetical protein
METIIGKCEKDFQNVVNGINPDGKLLRDDKVA